MRFSRTILLATGLSITLGAHHVALAADPVKLTLTIRNHKFEPAEITAPANTPIELTVVNADSTAEEFESKALKAEKVVAGGRSVVVRIQPQAPGRYPFVGEYHEETAKGVLIVTPPR